MNTKLFAKLSAIHFTITDLSKGFSLINTIGTLYPKGLKNTDRYIYVDPFSINPTKIVFKRGEETYDGYLTLNLNVIDEDGKKNILRMYSESIDRSSMTFSAYYDNGTELLHLILPEGFSEEVIGFKVNFDLLQFNGNSEKWIDYLCSSPDEYIGR